MHSGQHAYPGIEDKGVTLNYNTKIFETRHGPFKDFLYLTNYREFDKQVSMTLSIIVAM